MIGNTSAVKSGVSAGPDTAFDVMLRRKLQNPSQDGRRFNGTSGSDVFTGTSGNDMAYGRGGDDTLVGLGGDDILKGGRGNDTLKGGSGNDRLYGGSGDDAIDTGTGQDSVKAGGGNDTVVVTGSAEVDGGKGHDTVIIRGAESDYTATRRNGKTMVYVSKGSGNRISLRNVETVTFSDPTPPPKPPLGPGLDLAPNDAGAEQIYIGTDSVRIVGPDTDFTFTGLRDMRPVDGPLTATAGSGIINGESTTAVPFGSGEAVFSLGSGFNATGTQGVTAAFANGVRMESEIVRPVLPEPPLPPEPPVPGEPLTKNDAGAETISIGKDTIRILGPNTDVTFSGVTDGGQYGFTTAREGQGIVNGERVKAVPVDGAAISIGPFGFTGIRSVNAVFDNGVALSSSIPSPIIDDPVVPPKPAGGQPLGPNTVGAERIIISPGEVRIVGPETDFVFTGLQDNRPSDGPLTATAGSGTINGVKTTAVPLDGAGAGKIVFSLSSGFNITRTQTVEAAFATGDRLDTQIVRSDEPLPYQPPVSKI